VPNVVLICHRCGYSPPEGDDQVFCPNDGLHLVTEAEHKKSTRDLFLGTLVGDRYPVVGIVGRGGMGAVYRSVQPMVDREVAIKLILPADGAEDKTTRQRFLREARAIAAVAHPSIVTLYDFGAEEDGTLFMVMELVVGCTLRQGIVSRKLATSELIEVFLELLRALEFAHNKGLVHRDLKPDNVMLLDEPTEHNRIKVLDFGLARLTGMESAGGRLTRTGAVFGTPQYMSPEQAIGRGVDARTDLYAVGVMLFEGLAGEVPFDSEEPLVVLRAQVEAPVPDLPDDLPEALRELVKRSLAKDCEERFSSAAEMRQALAEVRPLIHSEHDPTLRWSPLEERRQAPALAATLLGHPGGSEELERRPATAVAHPAPLPQVEAPEPEPASLATLGEAAGESLRPTEAAALGLAGGSGRRRLIVAAALVALVAALTGAWLLRGESPPAPATTASALPPDPPPAPAVTPEPLDAGQPAPADTGPTRAVTPDTGAPPVVAPAPPSPSPAAPVVKAKKRRKRTKRKSKPKPPPPGVAEPAAPRPIPRPLPAPPPPKKPKRRKLNVSKTVLD